MRYLLTLMVILALASPAMSDCPTSDKQVTATHDGSGKTGLPQSTDLTPDPGCYQADWSFEFYRTEGTGSLTIKTTVDCMDEEVGGPNASYLSDTYEVREEPWIFSDDDILITNYSSGHLHIDNESGAGFDLFANMKLEVKNFEIEP